MDATTTTTAKKRSKAALLAAISTLAAAASLLGCHADARDDARSDDSALEPSLNESAAADAAALLKRGLHPDASSALRSIGVTSSMVGQTIGDAPASAGTHAQDGTVNGEPYSAATDLRIGGLTEDQIRTLIDQLGAVGFAAWYRKTGADGWSGATHVHAVWAGCPMKLSLQAQVRDWLEGKNGLQSHSVYEFYTWPESSKALVRARFLAANPTAS
jgi:hypothetical protein